MQVDSKLHKESALKVEVIWALEILVNSCSFRLSTGKGKLFSSMFPDSGKTKTSYLICHGLAPYFKERLLNVLNETRFIVTSFDESFNKVVSKGQMDVLGRFWNTAKNRVNTRYVNSVFMGKATTPDVLDNFHAASVGLNKNKYIQVSSDGPNVNLKFLELFAEKRKDDVLNELISVGTCSLHTVNRAFKNSENSTIWNIKLLCAMHKVFNKSPSKGADYERISSATKEDYPLFFCSTRCVENANVAKKAQKIWPKLVAVVEYWLTFLKISSQVEVIPSKAKVTRSC